MGEQFNKNTVLSVFTKMRERKWADTFGGGVSYRVNEDVYTIPTINMQMEAIGIRQVEQKMYNSFDNDICAGLLHAPFEENNNAIVHSHSVNAKVIATLDGNATQIQFKNNIVIQSIFNHNALDKTVRLPIINEIADIDNEIRVMNKSCSQKQLAVLVRTHGLFVWNLTLEDAYRQLCAYEHLFETTLKTDFGVFADYH